MDEATLLAAYGAWSRDVDGETAAKGLLAIGIVAGHDPEALNQAAGGRPLTELLTQAVADHEDSNRGRRWNSQRTCPWRDPLTLPDWAPDAVPPATEWAAAWDASGERHLRLDLTVSAQLDLARLIEVLRNVYDVYNAFVAIDSGPTTAWRFPLRFGFPPTARGRETVQVLKDQAQHSEWQSKLIEPLVLDRTRVSCDVLVVEGAAGDHAEDPTSGIESLGETRANVVVVTHPEGGLGQPTREVVDRIVDLTQAWAVGLVETSGVAHWIIGFVEELSHAHPLDRAFDTTSSGPRVLAADPDLVLTQTADQRAGRVASHLRSITTAAPPPPAAAPPSGHPPTAGPPVIPLPSSEIGLADQLTDGHYLHESGNSSELSVLEDAAAEHVDHANTYRRLKARIATLDQPDEALLAFRPGTDHTIEVHIGVPGIDSWLTAAEPFPEDQLAPDKPHELTIVLTEPDLLPVPQRRTIVLPVVGDSTHATFTLTTRGETAYVDARLIVLLGNRVLQTVLLPSELSNDSATAAGDVARPELTVAPATEGVADRRSFTAAFLVNHNTDGAARATTVTPDEAAMVRLNSEDLTTAVRKISQRLTAIVDRPESYESLDTAASVQLLVAMAFHGAKLHNALVTDTPGLAQLLTSRPGAIQVVAAKPDAYFPFEFAYDLPIPAPDASLCPSAITTLADPDPLVPCPGPHDNAVVCPLGFWALKHVIERHAYQPTEQLPADFALRSTPRRRDQVVRLGRTLFAASHRVDKVVPGSRDTVLAALAATGEHLPVDAWQDWKQAVRQDPQPVLLLLLAHTAHNNVVDAYGLEIGENDVALDFTDCLPGGPALALLLGCETAVAGAVSYERFPAEFRRAGAKVVVATLTEVLGRHAAPVAARLVEEIHRQCGDEPRGMGDVMLTLRRRLLADGMLPVLTLVAFGDADWLVGP